MKQAKERSVGGSKRLKKLQTRKVTEAGKNTRTLTETKQGHM